MLELPPLLQLRMTYLTDLPTETLNEIASYVGDADFFNLRRVNNRSICDGVDHIWVGRFITSRTCKTTKRSIENLEDIVNSRLARHVRSINIKMLVEFEAPQAQDRNSDSLSAIEAPLLYWNDCLTLMCSRMSTIFTRTTNLHTLSINSPLNPYEVVSEGSTSSLTNDYMASSINGLDDHQVNYDMGVRTASRMLFVIIKAIVESNRRIQGLAILDFTTNVWQATIPWTMPILTCLVKASSLRWLTSLELDLELFTDTSDEGMTEIVRLIEKNKMLKHLRLRAGIYLEPHLRPPSKNWSPLLDLLGTDRPPFRLQTLDLDGLITSGTTTLDRIINIHAPTLRRIVLNHINLRRPNSLRAFFAALTKTDLNFFATNNFLINDTFWLKDSVLKIRSKPDEVLEWRGTGSSDSDQTYKDWVHITWHTKRRDEWAIYDNVNGAYDELWMKDMIWSVIHSMDFSDIEP